jgi:ATP-dependent DNA helicase RecG
MPYTDVELEGLLADEEGEWVERKESWAGDAPDKGRQAVCAFANDLPNRRREGVLFVGVTDAGIPLGLEITDRLLQTLADIKTDGQTLPPPSITVEKRRLLGHDVAVIYVKPSDSPPVRYSGRIWILIGPRRGIATQQEERILAEKRVYGDKPFDIRPCRGSSLVHLDLEFFHQDYLTAAFSADVLEANERSSEERLSALKMIQSTESPVPTNVALLALGFDSKEFIPGSFVQFLRIDGTSLSDPILDSASITGRVDEIIGRLEEKLIAHNQSQVDIGSASKESKSFQYPVGAFRQLFRNAIMHRTYEATNAPIRVTWFSDRVEIQSPGGPFGQVSAENFGEPGVTDYRNPNLSDSLRVLGFVQRFGIGIATARRDLEMNGNPGLSFVVDRHFVTAIIRSRS